MDFNSKKLHENISYLLNCGLLTEAKESLIDAVEMGNQWAADALIAFSIKVSKVLESDKHHDKQQNIVRAISLANQGIVDAHNVILAFASKKDQSFTSIDIEIPLLKAGSNITLDGVHGGRYSYVRVFTRLNGNDESDSLFIPIKPIVVPAKMPLSCFVLTVCFGSEDAPTVNSFRDFRDNQLSSHAVGRAFIRWYYRCGPTIAHFLDDKPRTKSVLRRVFMCIEKILPK